jgi:phosphoglycolate phosphatase
MNAALRRFGFPVHPVDSYRYFVGDSVVSMVERSLPAQSRNQQTIEKCRLALTEEYHRRWANNTKPYPGIPELLSELEKQKIPKAVLSNKPHEFTVPMVEKMLPGFSFDVVLGVSEVVKRKPDPSAALLIAEKLGVPPTKILYLGDTNTDMQTAAAAGMFPVGALWGFRDKKELVENGAKAIAKKPLDVLKIFNG